MAETKEMSKIKASFSSWTWRTKSFVYDHSTRILSAIHKAHKTKGSRDKQPPRGMPGQQRQTEKHKTQSLEEEISSCAQEILEKLGSEMYQDLLSTVRVGYKQDSWAQWEPLNFLPLGSKTSGFSSRAKPHRSQHCGQEQSIVRKTCAKWQPAHWQERPPSSSSVPTVNYHHHQNGKHQIPNHRKKKNTYDVSKRFTLPKLTGLPTTQPMGKATNQ